MSSIMNDVFIINNFYKKCDEILQHISFNQNLYTFHEGDNAYNYSSSPETNDIDLIIDFCDSIRYEIQDKYNVKLKSRNHLTALIYLIGGQKGPHTDEYHDAHDLVNRKKIHVYSSVYYPNDDYVGGELCFPNINLKIKPEKNSLVLFPCEYLHYVEKITSGNKISITHFWELSNEL